MDVQAVLSVITKLLQAEPSIEGAFLCSPVLDIDCQDVANVEIGVATRDTLKDLRKAYGLHDDLLRELGAPVHVVEREWEHCKEVRALYGRSAYPPLGLCVRLVFCQLKHLAEQAPCASQQVLFDRSGAVKELLAQSLPVQPPEVITLELKRQLSGYPFHLHDAAGALANKDRATAQSAIEQMRKAIYYAAAVRAGQGAHGTKRGWHSLAPGEKWVLEHSYQHATLRSVVRLTDLYITCLTELQGAYPIEQDVTQLKQAVPELLR